MIPHTCRKVQGARFQVQLRFYSSGKEHINLRAATLNTGDKIPLLGIGTWRAPAGEVEAALILFDKHIYRHVDGAAIYGNEKEVGEGIKRSRVPRKDLWITSKLWNNSHRPEDVPKACQRTLDDLGIEYLDLYLIHWPCAFKSGPDMFPKEADGSVISEQIDFVDTWKAMEKLKESGKVKNIGISNFSKRETERLLAKCAVKPSVMQMEVHPHLAQVDYINWLQSKGMHVTAYSSFGDQNPVYRKSGEPSLVEEPIIKKIAERHGKTPHQVLLSWGVARGLSVIPKSSNAQRIKANRELFELTAQEVNEISMINKDKSKDVRYNDPSARFKYHLFQ